MSDSTQVGQGMWEPVGNAYEYHCQCANCTDGGKLWQHKLYTNQTEIGICYADNSDEGSRYVYLPNDLRLCRLVPATPAPTVGASVQLICAKCNDYLEPPSYCETCYDTAVNAWREAEAALAKQRDASVPSDADDFSPVEMLKWIVEAYHPQWHYSMEKTGYECAFCKSMFKTSKDFRDTGEHKFGCQWAQSVAWLSQQAQG